MRALLVLALLLTSACPEATPPGRDAGLYELDQIRQWREDCAQGLGPNPECPEKPT